MPRISAGCLFLIGIAALAQPASPLFRGRELSQDAVEAPEFPPAVHAEYAAVDSENSLLIRDCVNLSSGWCSDAALSFASIFDRLAKVSDPNGPSIVKTWFESARRLERFNSTVATVWDGQPGSTAPFHLLAVVNRIDLATFENGKWKGAELRFVFGLNRIGSGLFPPLMTMIVEFVLPPMTWTELRSLASDWKALSGVTLGSPAFTTQLKSLVAAQWARNPEAARIRTNSQLRSTDGWQLFEWRIEKGKALSTGILPDELHRKCVNGEAPTQADCVAYRGHWANAAAAGNLKSWPISSPPGLLVDRQGYSRTIDPNNTSYFVGMAMPYGVPNPLLTVRNVFSLQQCSFCHSGETGAKQMHIENTHPRQTAAKLSKFLSGNDPKPSITQLVNRDPAAIHEAKVSFSLCTIRTGGRCGGAVQKTSRFFHDIGRRTLFMAEILAAPASDPDEPARARILRHGPDFSH